MKMTKKILVGAVAALAMVVGFTGCDSLSRIGHKKFGETSIFHYNDATYDSGRGTWTIDGENDTTENNLRGIDCLTTKHNDMSAVLRFDGDSGDGVIGVVADASKSKETGNWSFLNIGVRKSEKVLSYYVSYFGNIVEDDLTKKSLGVADADKWNKYTSPTVTDIRLKKASGKPFEVDCTKLIKSSEFVTLNVDKSIAIAVDVKQNTDGGFTVKFYKGYEVYDKTKDTELKTDGKKPISEITILGTMLGKETDAQAWCGAYANVYASQNLKGTLEIVGLTKEGEDF